MKSAREGCGNVLQTPAARGEISFVLHQQAAEVERTTKSGFD